MYNLQLPLTDEIRRSSLVEADNRFEAVEVVVYHRDANGRVIAESVGVYERWYAQDMIRGYGIKWAAPGDIVDLRRYPSGSPRRYHRRVLVPKPYHLVAPVQVAL